MSSIYCTFSSLVPSTPTLGVSAMQLDNGPSTSSGESHPFEGNFRTPSHSLAMANSSIVSGFL